MELKEDDDVDAEFANGQPSKAQEYKTSGNEKFSNNNYKGAIVDYQKGLLHEPNNPDLHANLSAAYLSLERYVEAQDHAVYAIHLRPNFYKGYLRAAKADHGKGMTRLALKRLAAGITNCTDTDGVAELNRLKTQYTAYLSLQSNSERELDFDSDTYQSEDEEDEGLSTDEDSGDDLPPSVEEPEHLAIVASSSSLQSTAPIQPNPIRLPHVQTDPIKSYPILPDPISVDHVHSGPIHTDSNQSDNIPSDSIQSEPVHSDSIQSDHTHPDVNQPEPLETEPAQSEPVEPHSQSSTELQEKKSGIEQSTGFVSAVTDTQEVPESHVPDSELPTAADESKTSSDDEHKLQKASPEDKAEDKQEHPLEWLTELARSSDMKKSIADFKENLKEGGEAYLSGNYRRAAEKYKAAYERVGKRYFDYETEERQCNVIRYASYAAMINLDTYDDIVKSINGLNEMTKFARNFPAIYIQIARAYFKLNRYKTALEPLQKLQGIIDNIPIYPTFVWPGTNDTIKETTPIGLKDAIKELNQQCRLPYKPTATCRYSQCLKTTTHIVPSELIYSSDPDFIGYVRMICEEKCHIEFHIACWKAYKESICGIGKINDKDFLGQQCLTMDCINSEGTGASIITTIEIIGADGQVKSVNKLDPRANLEQKAAEKKAKKRKSKQDDKENKEKVTKPKKTKEKKVKTKEKKQVLEDLNDEEEDYETGINPTISADPEKEMQTRLQSLRELRQTGFNPWDWNPQKSFYGSAEETIKASNNKFVDYSNDSKEVADVKEYFFSYFHQILKDEGPLKFSDVEEHWKEQADDFFDVKSVLPNLKSICDLLLESNRFCKVEDYLCLADNLDDNFINIQEEFGEVITYLMTRPSCDTESQHSDSNKDIEDVGSFSGEESEDKSDSDSEDEDEEPRQTVDEEDKSDDTNDKFCLEGMLKQLSQIKNSLETKGSEELLYSSTETDSIKEIAVDSTTNETFETACGSSLDTTLDDQTSPNTTEDQSYVTEDNPVTQHLRPPSLDPMEEPLRNGSLTLTNYFQSLLRKSKAPESFENTECDKGSQSSISTMERDIQTNLLESKDRLSQTNNSDDILNRKLEEMASQLASMSKDNTRLAKELVSEKEIVKAQRGTITQMQKDGKRKLDALQEKMKNELLKKENEHKKREDELTQKMENMKKLYTNLICDNGQLKKQIDEMAQVCAEMKKSLAASSENILQLESNLQSAEVNMKGRLQKALQSQLALLRSSWETQLELHKKRWKERITEMQSWFAIVGASGEVETLPSYPLIHQNIMEWMETAKQLQQKENEFMAHYAAIGKKILEDPEMEDVRPEMLPVMPNEPSVPPLHMIHKEITDKHLKKISELTQLVVTQQLQIEKGKEQADQLTQMLVRGMSSPRGVAPPLNPMMASQYSFTGALPAQYSGPGAASGVPSVNQDATSTGTAPKLPEVHNLLQESSGILGSTSTTSSFISPPPITTEPLYVTTTAAAAAGAYSFPMFLPPPTAPRVATSTTPTPSMPPPPVGVAQSIFKTSTVTTETHKDIKKQEKRESTPKPEPKVGSSRESTPGPAPAPASALAPPTEKSKKKKKKAAEAAAAEARLAAAEARLAATAAAAATAVDEPARDDSSGWNLVQPKSAMAKHTVQPPASLSDGKIKNKKRLLDKLQMRFPSTPAKDIEEVVKQVRELNNGSLSGLAFDEIEVRVERLVTKKQLERSSTMGLVKFSDAAWGAVKLPEPNRRPDLHLEECAICLDIMGSDRTKVDCNHEFHTMCLRKWLKEKSVCPLCNNFTTMPDEFPAL